ncbi:Interferon-related developmental regulator 1 [Sparganum proliferum]
MPKKKSRTKQAPVEDDVPDDLSTRSRCSDDSETDPGASTETDPELSSASTLSKLAAAVDSLYEKRPDVRVSALQALIKTFRTNYIFLDDSWNYLDTFLSGLEGVMKKGKPQEQALAAECLAVSSVLSTPFDVRSLVSRFQSLLETKLADVSVTSAFRGACANALAILVFFGNFDDYSSIRSMMKTFEGIFRGSCLKGDGKAPTNPPPVCTMHCACIRAWGLVYTALPSFDAKTIGVDIMPCLLSLLQTSSLEVRIAAGDLIALVYERIRHEVDPDFRGPHFSQLIQLLTDLATDGTKSKSKVDLKKQRQSFRDVLNFLKASDMPFEQSIQVGTERLELTSCSQNYHYEVLCQLLAYGLNTHLQQNELVRSVFDMGPPVAKSALSNVEKSMNKAARHYANQFAFKVRTQYMLPSRDKRANVVDADVDM